MFFEFLYDYQIDIRIDYETEKSNIFFSKMLNRLI